MSGCVVWVLVVVAFGEIVIHLLFMTWGAFPRCPAAEFFFFVGVLGRVHVVVCVVVFLCCLVVGEGGVRF